ncbi:MAG: 30S ribosomal protein S14 [Candidatus Micrarchaeota archaeon]
MQKLETKFKKRSKRKCRFCASARGLIRAYGLYLCRRCFRERAVEIGFKKYS